MNIFTRVWPSLTLLLRFVSLPSVSSRGPHRKQNKEDIYLVHIQHLFLHVVPKTRKIVLNIIVLLWVNDFFKCCLGTLYGAGSLLLSIFIPMQQIIVTLLDMRVFSLIEEHTCFLLCHSWRLYSLNLSHQSVAWKPYGKPGETTEEQRDSTQDSST